MIITSSVKKVNHINIFNKATILRHLSAFTFSICAYFPLILKAKSKPTLVALMLIFLTSVVHAQSKPYQLMLAGGALKTCSSMSLQNCTETGLADPNIQAGKKELLYEVNEQATERLNSFAEKRYGDDVGHKEFTEIVSKLKNRSKSGSLTREQLFEIFDDLRITGEINNLPDYFYFALFDHLEFAQMQGDHLSDTPNSGRIEEVASILHTKSTASSEIYRRFVDEVKKIADTKSQLPHIVVITASSRDAFEVADFYQSVFSSSGVKTTWLPIDQALTKALTLKHLAADICQRLDSVQASFNVFDRERIYPALTQMQSEMCQQPHLLIDILTTAQGVFFNGGDQSKTRNALFTEQTPTAYMQTIIERVSQFDMIVGGTSAGSAVHAGIVYQQKPIPMISNGTSEYAVNRGAFAAIAPSRRCQSTNCDNGIERDDLTYLPFGGTGLFDIGIVDTHFSERDREARLAVLGAGTAAQYGVGVDETTALLYRKLDATVDFEVVGKNGVFVYDGREYQITQQQTQNAQLMTSYGGYAHYLLSGVRATLNLDKNQWQLSTNILPLSSPKMLAEVDSGQWRNKLQANCGTKQMQSWIDNSTKYAIAVDAKTHFYTDVQTRYCGYLFLPFVITNQ